MAQEQRRETATAESTDAEARVVRDGWIHRTNPQDGSALQPVAVTQPESVKKAVEKAHAAQLRWQQYSFDERVNCMKSAAKAMLDRRTEILQIVKRETGKADVDALFTEALGPLDSVGGWTRVIKAHRRQNIRLNPISFPKKSARIELVPRGVVGIIAPWNYPVAGLYRALMPALMLGNGVVLKPSEYTPLSSAWFAERLAEHMPEGLVQVIQGDGQQGQALLNAGINACVFTGSTQTGQKVRVRCAELGIPCSAEMGGNDAAIVLADCDQARTAAGITHWALHNAGQACGAVELVYVDARIADNFVAKLKGCWRALRSGTQNFAELDISPLSNTRQLRIVEKHVQDAVDKGATLVCGGQRVGQGLWFEPTLLDHCKPNMEIVKDETFGPVLAIIRIEGVTDAVEAINRNRFGLGASIWTKDIARAERIAERLDVGVVNVNNHAMTGAIPDLPWSGTRDTGFGIANSHLALTTFARPRTLLVDRNSDPEPFWMPFDPRTWELGDILADAQIMRLSRAWKIPVLIQKRIRRLRTFFGD